MASFHLFLTYCKFRNAMPIHMDIHNAYLHSKVMEELYMWQPPCFVNENYPNHICKIVQPLYGLHQPGHNWHSMINADLINHRLM